MPSWPCSFRRMLLQPLALCCAMVLLLPTTRLLAADEPATLNPSTVKEHAEAFIQKIHTGALTAMSDEQVRQTFAQLNPQVIPAYLEMGVKPLNEYELWMRREERLTSGWTTQPFLNYVKYRHQPRQVYMKWLKDSPKSGQEIIYDETKRKDASYGHIGGFFNVTSIWTTIDGSMAKGNSNHTVRDLGLQSIVSILLDSNRQRLKDGVPTAPDQIEITQVNGDRVVALTWVNPVGQHHSYAAKSRVCLDLKQPWVRQIESWDERGELFERITFDKIVPAQFTDADFDPKNSHYAF